MLRATQWALHTLLPAATLQLALPTPALAQPSPSSCNGTWRYTHLDKSRGWPADVEVRISGDQGTYVAHLGRHNARNSPCREKELPVVVQRCTADEFVFKVRGDTVLEGCPTFTARLKRTDPDTAEGTISRGQVVTARRVRPREPR